MEIFILWMFLAIIAGVIAAHKGRSGIGFFILAVLLSPLVGIIAALVALPNDARLEEAQIRSGQSKKCPFCAELIRQEATVCRYCGRDLNAPKNAGGPSGGPNDVTQQIQKRFQERYGGA